MVKWLSSMWAALLRLSSSRSQKSLLLRVLRCQVSDHPSENHYHYFDNRVLPPHVDVDLAYAEGLADSSCEAVVNVDVFVWQALRTCCLREK